MNFILPKSLWTTFNNEIYNRNCTTKFSFSMIFDVSACQIFINYKDFLKSTKIMAKKWQNVAILPRGVLYFHKMNLICKADEDNWQISSFSLTF